MFPNIISGISALGLVGAVRARKRLFSASPATEEPLEAWEKKKKFRFFLGSKPSWENSTRVNAVLGKVQRLQLPRNVGKQNFYFFSQNRSHAQL